MDPESSTESASIKGDDDVKNQKNERGEFVVRVIIFVATSIANIVSIGLGIPMFQHCFIVALVVMIIGSVLALLMQIPDFFRNFIKVKPEYVAYVNYSFGIIAIIRIAWLITSTVMIVESNCDNITTAWVCVLINWGILALIVIIVSVVLVVKFVKKKKTNRRSF